MRPVATNVSRSVVWGYVCDSVCVGVKGLNRWNSGSGGVDSCGAKVSCVRCGYTLALPCEYSWAICTWRRCGLITNWFDHFSAKCISSTSWMKKFKTIPWWLYHYCYYVYFYDASFLCFSLSASFDVWKTLWVFFISNTFSEILQ